MLLLPAYHLQVASHLMQIKYKCHSPIHKTLTTLPQPPVLPPVHALSAPAAWGFLMFPKSTKYPPASGP